MQLLRDGRKAARLRDAHKNLHCFESVHCCRLCNKLMNKSGFFNRVVVGRVTGMNTKPLPSLFVPHGSPAFALAPGVAGARMAEMAKTLSTVRALVVISPHWETKEPTVGAASTLETIHDFYGFDRRLYEIRYPAAGSPAAASEVAKNLAQAGFKVDTDFERGLDHGAWVPLMHMFPEADVPVVSLSVQHHGGPQHAYQIGQALAGLREQGFLIVGSGNLTHNLNDWRNAMIHGESTPAYVHEFPDWVAERLRAGDIQALLNYRRLHSSGPRAHPRDEHFLPFFTALGAAGEHFKAHAFYRGVSDVVLAMDGYLFH